uniref:EF-hand domain-containing protein n=1 Tax=Sinocyclocheilus rhinocerous TaxID=307959 RepID=A0A673IKX5_9TELE
MEAAIKTVVSVYLKSSKGKENLGGKEFQSLVKNQLKNILTDNEAVKNMRQQLDNNQDGKVSFQEYMNLIGYLAQAVSEQLKCFCVCFVRHFHYCDVLIHIYIYIYIYIKPGQYTTHFITAKSRSPLITVFFSG